MDVCVTIKLYLKKKRTNQIWSKGHGLLIPVLTLHQGKRTELSLLKTQWTSAGRQGRQVQRGQARAACSGPLCMEVWAEVASANHQASKQSTQN